MKDNTDKKADSLIFPILFNTNHSIEVYLKAICWTQNKLLGKSNTFKTTHDLKGLLKEVVDLENELNKSNDKAAFHEMLSNLRAYIHELYGKTERIIKDSQGNDKPLYDITFCRYTLTNDLEPQFYINTFDNVVVDLENYLTVFTGIFDNLQSLTMHYSSLLEAKQEHEYEARQIQMEMEDELGDY